jgi:hypothetical protein
MTRDLPDPERWCDLPPRGASAEQAVGAALRRVREATEPTDAALARVAGRIEARDGSTVVPRRGTLWLAWRLVAIAALVMATGGAVGAALYHWRRGAVAGRPAAAAVSAPARSPVARREAHRAPRAPVAPEAPAPAPAPAVSAVAAPEPLPATRPAASAHRSRAVEGPPPPSEAAALADAFHELRARGDATAALRALDEYERRFPSGALASEASIARAEALLALDRRREALPLLDGLEASGATPTRDVRITRGELRAEAGRCPDAVRDFDAVLVVGAGDAAGGRALYGRASCRLRAGDVGLARQDARRYLDLHADGPFAAAARRLADGAP